MLPLTNHYGYKKWSFLLASHNQNKPSFDLAKIKEAAKKENIEYQSLKVSRDIANLDYELSDVISCIQGLTVKNFYKSYIYQRGKVSVQADAYTYIYKKEVNDDENKTTDTLYIKFSLVDKTLIIDLLSFHLSS